LSIFVKLPIKFVKTVNNPESITKHLDWSGESQVKQITYKK